MAKTIWRQLEKYTKGKREVELLSSSKIHNVILRRDGAADTVIGFRNLEKAESKFDEVLEQIMND